MSRPGRLPLLLLAAALMVVAVTRFAAAPTSASAPVAVSTGAPAPEVPASGPPPFLDAVTTSVHGIVARIRRDDRRAAKARR
ncbi:MAG: hypothetical protein JWP18_1140, partial [Solirubrobacterales bacterium]|nr:hypothetical protein [Solirubrobacterales bacterium]